MSITTMDYRESKDEAEGWFKRTVERAKRRLRPVSNVPERGGNWLVVTGEVSAPNARLTEKLEESRELQETLRKAGGIGVAAASWGELSEDQLQELVSELAKPTDQLIRDALAARRKSDGAS
jgi:hypothetical protein